MVTKSSEFGCPKCQGVMARLVKVSEPVWRCGGCCGLWMSLPTRDRLLGQVEKIEFIEKVAASGDSAEERDEAAFDSCPECSGAMVSMVDADQPHVEFEQCATCGGVFLDAGELTDLSMLTLSERVRAIWRTRIRK